MYFFGLWEETANKTAAVSQTRAEHSSMCSFQIPSEQVTIQPTPE